VNAASSLCTRASAPEFKPDGWAPTRQSFILFPFKWKGFDLFLGDLRRRMEKHDGVAKCRERERGGEREHREAQADQDKAALAAAHA
jgi:hypothetical protein